MVEAEPIDSEAPRLTNGQSGDFEWKTYPAVADWRIGHYSCLSLIHKKRDKYVGHIYLHKNPVAVFAEARGASSPDNYPAAWGEEQQFETVEEAMRWAEAVARLG